MTPRWIGALLWLWCAAAGRPAPRVGAERFVGRISESHGRTALAPTRVDGAARLASPKPRGRWTPTDGPDANPLAPRASIAAPRARAARSSTIAPRSRRSVLSYDATAPPIAL